MKWGQKKISRLIESDGVALVHSAACNPPAISAPSSRRFGRIFAIGLFGAALVSSSAAVAQTVPPSESAQSTSPGPAAPASPEEKRIAADLLFKRLLVKPDDLDAGFRYAELETDLGDYEAAIGALERMLYYNPNLPRVKLQLGVLYFHLHSYEMARSYFNAVLASKDLPNDVRTEVQSYVAAVDRAVAINQFSVYAQAGLAYQTNANAGPNSPNVLALGQNALLSPQFQKTPDWNAFGLVDHARFLRFRRSARRRMGIRSARLLLAAIQGDAARSGPGGIADRAAHRARRLRGSERPSLRHRQCDVRLAARTISTLSAAASR